MGVDKNALKLAVSLELNSYGLLEFLRFWHRERILFLNLDHDFMHVLAYRQAFIQRTRALGLVNIVRKISPLPPTVGLLWFSSEYVFLARNLFLNAWHRLLGYHARRVAEAQ